MKHGLVSRRCGPDGQWVTVNGSQPWRDYSQCEDELEVTAEEVRPCWDPGDGWDSPAGAGHAPTWAPLRLCSPVQEGARRLMVSFKVLYTVGYSLSLLTLISALLVLTVCR